MSELDRQILKTIIDTAHDHYFVVNADGQVTDVSPGAAAVYGMTREELCAANVHELEASGVLKPSISLEVLRTGRTLQMMQLTATGRRVVAQAHPVFVAGKLECVVSRSMDLTDIQLLQQEYAVLQQRFSDHLRRNSRGGELGGVSQAESDWKTAGAGQSVHDTEQYAQSQAEQRQREQSAREQAECEDAALELGELQVRSPVMREIALLLKRVAPTNATVLMLGESGVGKTAFAHQLHRWSQRADGPFIEVNCGAIPESLFESEMFGYQAGAFTGAGNRGKAGLMEQAEGGTLFLDEIGELPLATQTKLLKVIQDGMITRLGDTTTRRADFRLVVATNQDLAARVEQGQFRLDLYYRINVLPVSLPPLRERREDIPALIEQHLSRLNQRHGRRKLLDASLWPILMRQDWLGNIRELENWLERAWLSAPSDVIDSDSVKILLNTCSTNNANGLDNSFGFSNDKSNGLGVTGSFTTADILHSDNSLSAAAAEGAVAMPIPKLGPNETLKVGLARIEAQWLREMAAELPSTYAIAKRAGISQPSVVRKLKGLIE
ncbi:sigma 54-interacting transcriptional regulator [Cobetia sp. 29-18-1]|uniref:sigma-54 interaction domain-containing protein n=1 Tax=Cobetia sp. 29-18-1 TaxID=3040018 RepID=UPI002447B5D8|nr:sigma 54-interacting transcriptional regulator [Cobetia sp. 29-18-1]MDH2297254.1 sigma 54-interacting transcriptional regulator [Cobetia sp. 29-18-1]